MHFITKPLVIITCLLLVGASIPADDPPSTADREAFFENKIRPLLIEKCYACHSAEKNKSKGGLTLDSQSAWLTGGEHGPSLIPGKPDESLLIKAVRYQDAEFKMPPKNSGGKLTDQQIALLEKWVRDGAIAPKPAAKTAGLTTNWWSFQPVQTPKVPAHTGNPIDSFLAAKHQAMGITPLGPAGRQTLLRRLTYDLIGLPPTSEDVQNFLNDTSPDAYAKVVDRLLASPQYGERWGRHWLDVVRYADSLDERSYDKEGDILDAWRYRDWVANAFNHDLPYDQFIVQQIAGDILAQQPGQWSADKIIATGMYAIGNWGNGDADKEKLHTDIVDDQVDVTSRAFLGLTVACARCHDHKFDPISTRDYYALSGFFFSSHILDKFQSKGEGEKLMRIPLQSPEEKKQNELAQARIRAIDKELSKALRPLSEHRAELAGIKGLHAWVQKGTDNPSVVINTLDKPVTFGTIKMRANTIAVHPGPQIPVTAVWKSTIAGKITINAKLHDADPNCGNGIDWELRHVSKTVHKGVMENAGSITLPESQLTVQKDDLVVLIIGPRGDYSCDSTEMEFTIKAENGTKYDLRETLQQTVKLSDALPWSICSGAGSKLASDDAVLSKLEAERSAILKKITDRPFTQGLLEGGVAGTTYSGFHEARVHQRGSYNRLGEMVPRGFPAVLATKQPTITQGSGRLELARWIANPSHPLTARVMVNRIWQHHFGEGLVRTPNNFGKLGTPPSHQELLDYLAGEFVRNGWSIKAMHRLIVTSQAYQRTTILDGSKENQKLLQLDPENVWLTRQHRRRLSAEELRDSLLTITGELDKTLGGKAIRDLNTKRRTMYVTCIRSDRATYQTLFDAADPTAIVEKRTEATVAPQSLWLLNHPFVMDRARVLAELVARQTGSRTEQMNWLTARLFARPATSKELALAERIVSKTNSSTDWEMLCQALFCSNEFIYLD